ncbi:hypothetical protein D3C76_1055100 [compost metagenome]
MPDGHGRGHRPQPLHPRRTQFCDREGFQGFVEYARQLRLCIAHCKAVGSPHAFDTAPHLELTIALTPHRPIGTDFTVDGRVSFALSYQFTGLLERIDQAQANLRMLVAYGAFQRMFSRQDQYTPRKLLQ